MWPVCEEHGESRPGGAVKADDAWNVMDPRARNGLAALAGLIVDRPGCAGEGEADEEWIGPDRRRFGLSRMSGHGSQGLIWRASPGQAWCGSKGGAWRARQGLVGQTRKCKGCWASRAQDWQPWSGKAVRGGAGPGSWGESWIGTARQCRRGVAWRRGEGPGTARQTWTGRAEQGESRQGSYGVPWLGISCLG